MTCVTLRAADLAKKHGFYDGDILDRFYEASDELSLLDDDRQEVLKILVRQHLLSDLQSIVGWIEVDEVAGCHNPIRLRDETEFDRWPKEAQELEIEIDDAMFDNARRRKKVKKPSSRGRKAAPLIASVAAAALLAGSPAPRLPGLIIDNFAGGGGASTGIEAGMRRPVDIAINHDEAAIAVHKANHPHALHFCQSVWDVLPAEVVRGREVDLAWFSPDCKHFSKAKGGKPVEKKIRDLAWVVVRWAECLPDDQKPKVIMLENVEEFQDWGPLVETDKGPMPCLKQKGAEFRRWLRALRRQGYKVQVRMLRACDFRGDVHLARTRRKRLFLVARRDGHAIVWPKPTHGDPKSLPVRQGKLLPWYTAADCIDWSNPCPSIFDRRTPLTDNTCRRIAAGIMRYVVNAAEPFIVPLTHHGDSRTYAMSDPVPTVTGAHRGELAVVEPLIVPVTHTKGHNAANPASSPLGTITTAKGGEFAVLEPVMISGAIVGCGGRMAQTRPIPLDMPTATTTQKADACLVTATVAPVIDSQYGKSRCISANEPMPTPMAGGSGKQALVEADLVRAEQVAAFMAQHNGGFYEGEGHPVTEPTSTITQRGTQQQLVTSHLIKLRGTCADGQAANDPMPTITAGGMHVGEVRCRAERVAAFLCKYYGAAEHGQDLGDPMHTATAKARFGLITVTIKGEPWVIVDIGMRMLTPRELARAQGFPDTYKLDPECWYRTESGKMKFGPLPKTHQVAKIGNSVCPVMAEVLTAANCYMYRLDYDERVAA